MAAAGAPPPENALIPSEATRSVDDCESSGGSGGLNQAIHFSSGNPRIEETRGVIRLYPQEEDPSPSSLAPLLPVERKPMVCVVAVPNHMTYADFCCFCASFFQQMLEMKVVRNDGMKDQYSILITFDGQSSADSFYQHFNGKRFSSLEVDICHVLYTLDVQYTGSIEHAQKSLPSAGEQPTCPVCLERLDQDTSGILTTICNHSFHSSCISKWTDSSCPVCRYCQQQPEKSTCSICGTSENLWICVICGFVGCGRYKEGHAIRHWKETQHCYSLDLESQRVWDYVGDNYVHRLIHSKADGNPVELNFQCAHADDVCGVCECGADSAVSEALINSKLDAEYNNLLASQVEDQRKYYNLFLQESKVEQEKEISETIEKALHSKLQKLQAKLEICLQEKRFLGDINENLKKNQDMWKEKIIQIEEREQAAVRLRNEKIQTLEEQHRRLIVQIEAPESVDELPGSPSGDIKDDLLGDIKGGKILPVPNTSSSRSNVSKRGTRNRR